MVSQHTYFGSYADQKRHEAKESTSEVMQLWPLLILNISEVHHSPV